MLALYQIEDIVIHWHPLNEDGIEVSAKTEKAYNNAFNFYWSEAEFDTSTKKLSGYLLDDSRHLPPEKIARQLKRLIGRPTDLFAYDAIYDTDCCCLCGGSAQTELVWLHTMGMIKEVVLEWDDKSEAYRLELVLDHNPVWMPLNRFFWDFSNHLNNLFFPLCFDQDPTYSADRCTGGTPTASSTNGGNVAASAFDNNSATYWQSTNTALPHTLEYDFGVDRTIRRYSLTAQSQLQGWTLEYYNGTSWVVADQRAYEPLWVGTETRTYDFYTDYTAQRWRININAINGGTQAGIYELEMFEIATPAAENYAAQMSAYPRGTLTNAKKWVRKNYEDAVVAYQPDLWSVLHGYLRPTYPKTGWGTSWVQGDRLYTVSADRDIWSAAPFSLYAFTNISGADDVIIEVKRQISAWDHETRTSRINMASLANAMLPYGGILPSDILILGDVNQPPGFVIRSGQILVDDTGKPSVVPEIEIDVPFGRLGEGVNHVKMSPDRNLWAAVHTYRRY